MFSCRMSEQAGMRRWYLVALCALAGPSIPALAQNDLIDITPFKTMGLQGKGQFAAFHPAQGLVAVGSGRGLSVFHLDDGRSSVVAECSRGSAVAGATSRDGSHLALGCDDGSIFLADWEGRAPGVLLGRGHTKPVASLNFSPDGGQLVSASEDRAVVVWDVPGRRETTRFQNDAKRAFVFAGYADKGASIVALTEDGQMMEWDAKTGKSLRKNSLTDNQVLSGGLNAAGTLLAIATEFARLAKGFAGAGADPSNYYREDRLLIYDLTKGSIVKQIDGVDGQLRSLSFSSESRFLTAVRQRVRRTYLSVFDLQRGTEVFSQEALDRGVLAAFSPNGQYLAGLAVQGQLAVFKVRGILVADVGLPGGPRIQPTSPSQEALLPPNVSATLAIMDLDSLRVEKDVGRQVSEMLRNRIVGANLRVVATDRMQEIIKQQNFQLSDRTDSLTAVALGRILNANKIIFGSVGALDNTYVVSVQLVDVETARVEGIREVKCERCGLSDLPEVVGVLQPLLVGLR